MVLSGPLLSNNWSELASRAVLLTQKWSKRNLSLEERAEFADVFITYVITHRLTMVPSPDL